MGWSGAWGLPGAFSEEAELRRPHAEPTEDERETLPLLAEVRRLRTLPPSLLMSTSRSTADSADSDPRSGIGGGIGAAMSVSAGGKSWRPSDMNSVRMSSSATQKKPPVLPADSGVIGMYE